MTSIRARDTPASHRASGEGRPQTVEPTGLQFVARGKYRSAPPPNSTAWSWRRQVVAAHGRLVTAASNQGRLGGGCGHTRCRWHGVVRSSRAAHPTRQVERSTHAWIAGEHQFVPRRRPHHPRAHRRGFVAPAWLGLAGGQVVAPHAHGRGDLPAIPARQGGGQGGILHRARMFVSARGAGHGARHEARHGHRHGPRLEITTALKLGRLLTAEARAELSSPMSPDGSRRQSSRPTGSSRARVGRGCGLRHRTAPGTAVAGRIWKREGSESKVERSRSSEVGDERRCATATSPRRFGEPFSRKLSRTR